MIKYADKYWVPILIRKYTSAGGRAFEVVRAAERLFILETGQRERVCAGPLTLDQRQIAIAVAEQLVGRARKLPSKGLPVKRFRVYVIELDPRAGDGTTNCFYVGLTAYPPWQRFAQHLAGHRASEKVRKWGRRLRADLMPKRPKAWAEGDRAEGEVAADLRQSGYVVFAGGK